MTKQAFAARGDEDARRHMDCYKRFRSGGLYDFEATMHFADKSSSSPSLDLRDEEAVEELSLLVPRSQLSAVAEAARRQGLTIGQFLRRAIQQALAPITYARQRSATPAT